MAFNILDLLKSQLGGQIAGQLGKQFGESETSTKAGVDALIPTILGGLLKQVSSPGGPEKLDKTIKEGGYDGGLLDGLSGMLTGGGADKLSGKGGDLVSSLFGDKAAMLLPILSKLTGLKLDSVQSMLAMLLPLVMSFLGKQQKAMGLDASGLASMLISQKDSISAALPPGVSDAMGIANLSTPAASRPAPVASKSSGSGSGIMPKALIALAIVAAVGYGCYLYIFAGILPSGPAGNSVVAPPPEGSSQGSYGGMQPNGQPIQPAEPAASEAPATEAPAESPEASDSSGSLTLPGLGSLSSLGGMPDLEGIFGSVGKTFEKITDVESAKAALPELESANNKLQGLSSGFAAMPEAMRTKIAEVIQGTLPDLQGTIDKVLAIPGVSEILKPIVDQMMEKVAALKG
jgi:hypothetical protein